MMFNQGIFQLVYVTCHDHMYERAYLHSYVF